MYFRDEPNATDPATVRKLVSATGFFTDEEVAIAVELVQASLDHGVGAGYSLLFVESDGATAGYTCYGPIPGAEGSFDLYWIAVDPKCQGCGLGRKLIEETERRIRETGGRCVYIETSSRDLYLPTRNFYSSCGYKEEAVLKDFYRPGDSKVIYSKRL